jgi:hypothetical protein
MRVAETLIIGARERRASDAAYCLAATAAIVLLLTPAIWNGFPLIFPDTGGYLQRPLTGTLELGRSALYGLFLASETPAAFWPNIALQAALIVWLIALTLRVHRLDGRPLVLLGAVAALSVTTSLPWFVSQLMPDVLFPAGALALYLLAFGRDDMRTGERIGLVLTIAFAIASHMAFMAVALGLVAALLLAGLLKSFPTPRLGLAALALAAGLLLAPLSNLAITGKFAMTPGGSSFLFNRLVEDGMVTRYLDEACPDLTLRICPYRDQITTDYDDWLWRNDTPFWKLGGWKDYSGEERRIILATIARYPLEHVENAIAHSADQLVSFATEVATDDDANAHTTYTFREFLPQLYRPLMEARQQTGRLDIEALNWIHIPVGALAMLGLAGALAFRRRLGLPPQATALAATVLLALIVNAAVCGVFSHAAERYQSRLMPLAPLALTILLVGRRRVC